MSGSGENSGIASGQIVAPLALAFLIGVCDAIEAFTKAQIERDPDVFRPRGIDLRHAVERHLYFKAINSAALRQLFIAASGGPASRPREMPLLLQQFAPFLVKTWRPRGHWHRRLRLAWREPGWKSHREKFRAAGGARVERANWPQGQGVVLFQVVQAKFLPFLRPIAEALQRPYGFVVFDDPVLFAQLEGLPRLGITLDDAGREQLRIERFGLLEFFSTLLNGVVEALAEVQPACIVVPEGNAPLNELFCRAAHSRGIPSLCIQQGWSPVIHNGFRAMTYDRMCVWGAGFAEALAPFNPRQRFVATGSHVLTPHPRAPAQSGGAIAFFLQPGGSPLITPAAAAGMLDLASWAAQRFSTREIRVRPHPGAPLTAKEEARLAANPNIRILPADKARLAEVLDSADIAVSIFSTTILEAAAAGVIPLIVNVAGLPHYNPDIAFEGAAVEVKDFEAARQALSRLIEDREFSGQIGSGLAGVAGRYFARGGADAVSAIAAQIETLASGADD